MKKIKAYLSKWIYNYGVKCAGVVSYKTTYEMPVPVTLQRRVQVNSKDVSFDN